jgi:NAD(P)-dependent dehydrogenase (short-subunit alcohol dehydrogenase family)
MGRGRVDTEMMKVVKGISSDPNVKQTWDTPINRMSSPDEIAALIAFMLGDECRFMTGSAVTVDGGKIA